MFSQKHRLNSRCFEEVLKSGKAFYFEQFKLIYLADNSLKIAIVVSKKVAKLSVLRHRMKRRVSAALKKIKSLPESGSFIVFVQKNILMLSQVELEKSLMALFNKFR